MADKKLDKMVQQHEELHSKIMDAITKLPSYGGDCSCEFDNRGEGFVNIHKGEFDEVEIYCLDCGGIQEGNF